MMFRVKRDLNSVEITTDAAFPNVLFIDRNADSVLVQKTSDHFEVRQGNWHAGDVVFCDAGSTWGWRFIPRHPALAPSLKLHRFPEAALGRKFRITGIYRNGYYRNDCQDEMA